MKRFLSIVVFGWAALASAASFAASDALIEGAKLCTKPLPRYEREYAIPTHLLSAIASTESGRYHEGLRIKLPWPWTINVEGKGYFFETKEKAIAAVKKYRAQGIQSIDVGCMQVNLFHHADAFASLDQAFDPEMNVAYAAGFLRTLYNEGGTWKKAAGDYHSKTPKLGQQYVGLVYDSWFNIIDKLRAARLHVPESSVAGMNELKSAAALEPASGPAIAAPQPKKLAAHVAPHMNSISVSEAVAHNTMEENGVLVVRPVTNKTEIYTPVAAITPVPADIPQPAPVSLAMVQVKPPGVELQQAGRILPVSDTVSAAAAPSGRKTGPNFIFND